MTNKHWMVLVAVIVLGLPLVLTRGQWPGEANALRQEVERLRADQKELKAELDSLRTLVGTRPAAPAAAPTPEVSLAIAGDPVKGSRDARVVVVEFSDYHCPFCKRHATAVFPQLDREYIQTGKIQYVFRDFPIEGLHPQASKSHEAANCAGEQNKYWQMHDRLFSQPPSDPSALAAQAQAVGMDVGSFRACLDSGRHAAEIQRDIADGQTATVSATPTFFIGTVASDGTVLSRTKVTGAQSYAGFKAALDRALATQQ